MKGAPQESAPSAGTGWVFHAPVLPESPGTRKWRRFRGWVARTRLENYPSARALMNAIGETFARLLSWLRGFEFPAGHPWPTRLLYLFGWYETETVAVCKRMLRPGMVVLDIGAHNGYFTLLFSRLVGPTGRVFAFEPHEPTCRLLNRNLRRARHPNVTVVEKAVADQPGIVEFFEMSLAGTHSLFDVARFDPQLSLCRRLTAECVTLDEFLAARGNPRVDFIKMDIEGAEPKALCGMTETIRRSPSLVLIVEFNLSSLRAAGTSPQSFLAQLSGLGFDVQVVAGHGDLLPIDDRLLRAAQQSPMNLLCSRKGSDS